jgi:enoyl-CoA hydratase
MSSLTSTVVDGVLVMTMDRPLQRNAIDRALADELLAAHERLDQDADLRVGVLAGAGPAFCAGMDLKAFVAEGPPRSLFSLIRRRIRKPLIAAVDGAAMAGGFELALACDLILASPRAQFGLPEVQRGLIAGAGGLFRLPRRVGQEAAMRIVLTGEPIDAAQALSIGLVSEVVDDLPVLERAVDLARRIASGSPLALELSKRLLLDSPHLDFDAYWDLQRPAMKAIGESPDSREGALAFAERRQPRWQRP